MLIMLLAASLEVSYEHTLNDKEVCGEGRAMQSKYRADFYSLVHTEKDLVLSWSVFLQQQNFQTMEIFARTGKFPPATSPLPCSRLLRGDLGVLQKSGYCDTIVSRVMI